MANSYITEPPPTASATIHTTAGPITISLFAQQTPLTCRNFLQHCLDGYYDDTIFHRISSGFVIQTGDPTGTGEGGTSIYEESKEFETYDAAWAKVCGKEVGEKIVFGDEVHSRLRFGRRGLVGMAKDSSGGYGSQWFITLGDCRAELDGKMTMFGRVEGNGIYNVVKIAEGEVVGQGSERPVYPEKVLRVEVTDWPKGEAWEGMRRRERTAVRSIEKESVVKKKEKGKKKAGKALLSFGGGDEEDGGESVAVRPKKAKFNTALIDGPSTTTKLESNGTTAKRKASPSTEPNIPAKRRASSPPSSPERRRRQSHSSPQAQLPIRNEESPSNSPSTPSTPIHRPQHKTADDYESQISALKASMRRDTTATTSTSSKPKSALEAMIPATSTRGRKRPRPGDSLQDKASDASTMKMLQAFRQRLEAADRHENTERQAKTNGVSGGGTTADEVDGDDDINGTTTNNNETNGGTIDEEAQLCDLHFIANCQSCSRWDENEKNEEGKEEDNDRDFLSHRLAFGKDVLGKDLDWRKKDRNKDEDDGGLVVIDPRAKEKEIKITERERKRERRR